MCFLTGGVDEVTKDSQGAHSVSLITVFQLLKNKHNQSVWEGVSWRERSVMKVKYHVPLLMEKYKK